MSKTLAIATLTLFVLAAPATADTPKTAASGIAEVDIAQAHTGATTKQRTRVAVALVENGATSKLSTRLGDAFYTISVRQYDQSGESLVALQVEGTGPKDMAIVDLSATTRVRPGKRIVVGQVAGPDGRHVEIGLTIK